MADIPTTNLDAGTDSPAAARGDLLLAVQRVNTMYGHGAGYVLATRYATIADAHAAATAAQVPLVFPPGTYSAGTSSFVVDLTKTEWIGLGNAAIQWTGAPASGYGVRLVGTSDYMTTHTAVRTTRLPTLLGSTNPAALFAGAALQIGDGSTYTQGLDLDVRVQGFAKSLEYMHNVWRITIRGYLKWGDITCPPSPLNFGECMAFVDAFIADGPTVSLTSGIWSITGGSIDNATLVASGEAWVACHGVHLENPGSSTNNPLIIDVAGVESTVTLNACQLTLNDPGGAGITDGLFRVAVGNTTGGLVINGLQYSQQTYFNFTANDDYKALVRSGGGRVVIRDLMPLSFSNFYFVLGADAANALGNGSFENAAVAPWQGSGVVTIDSSVHITGKRIASANSCRLNVTAVSGYAQVSQLAPVRRGELVTLFVWARGDGTSGHDGAMKFEFLDANGNTLAVGGYGGGATVASSGTAWNMLPASAFAPAGARYVYVTLSCSRSSSDGAVYFDAAVLNIT